MPHNEQPPPHLFLDHSWYLITCSTRSGALLFQPPRHKDLVRDSLRALVIDFKMQLAASVLLDNHARRLIRSETGAALPRFLSRWHGRTAFQINGLDQKRGRQVWSNYWDTCIRKEQDSCTRFNYVHYNPVKHGYCQTIGEWEYSSYRYYCKTRGEEWLTDLMERYPVVDFGDVNGQGLTVGRSLQSGMQG